MGIEKTFQRGQFLLGSLIFNEDIPTRQVMEMPQQLKMKAASKAVKLNVNMSQVRKRSK